MPRQPEKVQRSSAMPFKADRKGMLAKTTWRELQAAIREKLAPMELPDNVGPVLKNKVSILNQFPQELALQRLLDRVGLRIGEAELGAWSHRNMTAHDDAVEDVVNIIHSVKLSRLPWLHARMVISGHC